MAKSLQQLIDQAKLDPRSLTPAEITQLKRLGDTSSAAGMRQRDSAARRSRDASASVKEIGAIPPVQNPERKKAAGESFKLYCETYFPNRFFLGWSTDHDVVLSKIELAARRGGSFAVAMPRGSGKTTICEVAELWATSYGYRKYGVLIGPTDDLAKTMLMSIRAEVEDNDLLLADFPEIFYPVRCLEGVAQRSNSQTYQGNRTHMRWGADELVFPMIPGSVASGAIITVAGLTGQLRGMKRTRHDGQNVRPDFVLLDDPQTAESAWSPQQCLSRGRIIARDVARLAGPGVKLTAVMPCTVIRKDDLADEYLDTERHPEWRGERTKMLYAFPKNIKMWEGEYDKLRRADLKKFGFLKTATEFYKANRSKMDAGAHVAWEANFEEDELTGIQHAMNLYLTDSAGFAAECQNEPVDETLVEGDLTADDIAAKINRHARGVMPLNTTTLTAMIDIHDKLLYYAVCAWGEGFTGAVIDYGAWPKQSRRQFTMREARGTLRRSLPGAGLEAAITNGLTKLTDEILGREWRRDDGAIFRVSRCLIDANWGQTTDVVYQFARQSAHAPIILPSHGKGITASNKPMGEYDNKPGDRAGFNWRIPAKRGRRVVRHIQFDTNFWKSFLRSRLLVPMGGPGSISLYGSKPEDHRMLAEHLVAEYFVRVEGRGRTVDESKERPNHPDNHLLDCMIGCVVAASMEGIKLHGQDGQTRRKKSGLNMQQRQQAKLRERGLL